MYDRRLNRILGTLHQTGSVNPPRPEHRDELESRLRSGFRAKSSRNRRWLMLLNPWNRTTRFAFVGLTTLILGLGACSTSTTTDVEVGQQMTIALMARADLDVAAIDADLMAFFDTQAGMENVSVSISETIDGPVVYNVMAWGTDVDQDQLQADLRRAIPTLAEADIQVDALTGTIEESLASKFKRRVFRLEVDGATEEEIRAQVLAQLARNGNAEGTVVDVILDDGITEIHISVEEQVED